MANIEPLRHFLVAAAMLGMCAFAVQAAEPDPSPSLVTAARLLDPRSGSVLAPAAVLIADGKIREIGDPKQVRAHAPAGTMSIDLGPATLLPGMIDGHTRLLLDVIVPPPAEVNRTFSSE